MKPVHFTALIVGLFSACMTAGGFNGLWISLAIVALMIWGDRRFKHN